MAIKLGRRETVERQPYTGPLFCGCRMLNGYVRKFCDAHREGKHRSKD